MLTSTSQPELSTASQSIITTTPSSTVSMTTMSIGNYSGSNRMEPETSPIPNLDSSSSPASITSEVSNLDQTTTTSEQPVAPRLIQSEFGQASLGGGKRARSTFKSSPTGARQTASPDRQHPNHKYDSPAEAPIYSTSPNQGSVSYMPIDEMTINYLMGHGPQAESDQERRKSSTLLDYGTETGFTSTLPTPTTSANPVSSNKKIERRYGTRLLNYTTTITTRKPSYN